jgi:hypothetical protein
MAASYVNGLQSRGISASKSEGALVTSMSFLHVFSLRSYQALCCK